ncbi:MAG: ExbD/TolR family protein [Elusimicrobiota bacterium]|jgi:biopolymer transport protein ExbD|nr:ExbD/TolR family protein [Elusimicrobiota bacterium]
MSEINITPFTDVVLVLLIIFMITTPMFLQPGIKVNLPQTQTQEEMEETNIEITITKNGEVLVNGTQIHESNLENAMKTEIARNPNKPVVIRGDKDVKYDNVIKFMDLARSAGANRFALAADLAKPDNARTRR